jgi:hypothetical protein
VELIGEVLLQGDRGTDGVGIPRARSIGESVVTGLRLQDASTIPSKKKAFIRIRYREKENQPTSFILTVRVLISL